MILDKQKVANVKLKNRLVAKYYPCKNPKTQRALEMCTQQLKTNLSKGDVRKLKSKAFWRWCMLEITISGSCIIQLLIGYPTDLKEIREISKLETEYLFKWTDYVIYQNKAYLNVRTVKGSLDRRIFTYAVRHRVTPEVARLIVNNEQSKEIAIR